MTLTVILVGVFFAAMMAILYFGFEQAEKDRAERAAAEAMRESVHPPGRTADEVVFDLEHRIDSDLKDIAALLGHAAIRPHRA